jgi:Spy/CpxP family protein refolding chaperone
MNMKKIVMLGALMMASVVIFAQDHAKDPQARATKATEKMKQVLSLSDTQYASIKAINEKYTSKKEEPGKNAGNADRMAERKSLMEAREKEINIVLTPEQKTKWESFKAQRAEKMKAHKKERIEKNKTVLKETLSLTDEQQTKIEAVNKTFKEKRQALKSANNEASNKEAWKKLKEEHETAVKAILTPEQYTKWTTLNAERKNGKHHGR